MAPKLFIKHIFALFLLSIVGCSSASKEHKIQRAEALLQIGTSNLVKGNYPLALKALLEAAENNPDHPVIQNNLGLSYYVRQKYDLAETHIKKAISLAPTYTDARNNLGRLYADVGAFDKAIDILSVASEDLTYPDIGKIWANLGFTYFKKGDYKNAKQSLFKAVKNKRNDCESLNYYGRSLLELREYSTAAETLDKTVRQCMTNHYEEPHFYSAVAYMKLGRTEEAEARFEEIIKLYPDGDYAKKSQKMLETMK